MENNQLTAENAPAKIITKLGSSNFALDIPNNRIDFLDTRFYVTAAGAYVPSVTTILSAYPKGAQYYEWLKKVGDDADQIRDEAGNRGSTVHKLTELYDDGHEVTLMDEQGHIDYKLIEWNMFEKYVDFRTRYQMEIVHTEMHLSSDLLAMAGTLDRVIRINGKTLIIDIKTSNSLYDHYWLQMSAYKKLLAEVQPELKIDGYAILWLNSLHRGESKKGDIQGRGWCFKEQAADQFESDWKKFEATKLLWLAENEGMKPRQTSYQLKHKLQIAS